jgi:hypothetical protein
MGVAAGLRLLLAAKNAQLEKTPRDRATFPSVRFRSHVSRPAYRHAVSPLPTQNHSPLCVEEKTKRDMACST